MVYRKSLLGVKDAALKIQEIVAHDSTGKIIQDPITLAMSSAALMGGAQHKLSLTPISDNGSPTNADGSVSPTSPDDDGRQTVSGAIQNIISSAVQLKWNAEGERREAKKVEKTLHTTHAVQRREYLHQSSSSVPATAGAPHLMNDTHQS